MDSQIMRRFEAAESARAKNLMILPEVQPGWKLLREGLKLESEDDRKFMSDRFVICMDYRHGFIASDSLAAPGSIEPASRELLKRWDPNVKVESTGLALIELRDVFGDSHMSDARLPIIEGPHVSVVPLVDLGYKPYDVTKSTNVKYPTEVLVVPISWEPHQSFPQHVVKLPVDKLGFVSVERSTPFCGTQDTDHLAGTATDELVNAEGEGSPTSDSYFAQGQPAIDSDDEDCDEDVVPSPAQPGPDAPSPSGSDAPSCDQQDAVGTDQTVSLHIPPVDSVSPPANINTYSANLMQKMARAMEIARNSQAANSPAAPAAREA